MEVETVQLSAEQVADTLKKAAAAPPPEPIAAEPAPQVKAAELASQVKAAEPAPPQRDEVVAALEAQLAELKAKISGADASGVRAELETLRSEISAADVERLAAARNEAFERLRIDPDYYDVVPKNLDPRTPEGRRGLEEWIAKRPRLTRSGAAKPPPAVASESFAQPVRQILSGERSSGLVSGESIAKMLASGIHGN